ncbi:MAG: DUF1289 domain-containing protein [Motiliproteus sp.]
MNDAELIAQAEMSPCVGVCAMDQDTGWCFGCGRSDAEIKGWQSYGQDVRQDLESSLIDRVKQLIERRRAERGDTRRGRRTRS